MYPVLFTIGNYVVPSWHVFFALAAICSFYLLRFLLLKTRVTDEVHIFWFFAISYIAGLGGARSFSLFFEYDSLGLPGFWDLDSFTLYGGILGGGLAGLTYLYKSKLPTLEFGDVAGLSVLLGIGIGRIGCFLNGDDYGQVVADPLSPPIWAVSFPYHNSPVPRIPVQLIETALTSPLALVGAWLYLRRSLVSGVLLAWAMAYYAVLRFVLEFYRADYRGWIIQGALSPSQAISIVLVLGSALILAKIGPFYLRSTPGK